MAAFDIDGDLVRKLAGLLEETGLAEIEFAEGERRIRVTRAGAAPAAFAAPPAHTTGHGAAAPPVDAGHPPAGAVTSPMVGTVYLAPEPGAAPFVKAGDAVGVGDTLLIIEAMKVMNPIRAAHGGTVRQIAVTDGQPVEYGDVLMVVD
jgi:acetyl-CoA carboxylase biotin carboxyl carrier protein